VEGFVVKPRLQDSLLLGVMAIGAACGLIYEYLIAHYAGRILGSVDTVIYGMIGLMIVSMGIGAFYSRLVSCAYTGFAWLESGIALLGGVSVLFMATLFSVAYVLPQQLQHAYGLSETINLQGGPIFVLAKIAESFPYFVGFFLGAFIGMEIPFIARIREEVYGQKLKHNAGTVYGADYIGAGVGAAIWILVCLKLPIVISAALTAMLNLLLGSIFLAQFKHKIKHVNWLIGVNAGVAAVLLAIGFNGNAWLNALNNMLYEDKTVYSYQSKFQNLVLTERITASDKRSVLNLYINGHLQFSSADESIYHDMLVAPAMMAAARRDNILIVGGGDGLALSDVLRWQPKDVTLIDLDPAMIELFSGQRKDAPGWLSERLLRMNEKALQDPRVDIINADAFKTAESLALQQPQFDVIIVDLPDPNHPDLNKLYSDYFYAKLAQLLVGDGALVVQSTSPYHSKKAFISIGRTMASVGLMVDQYHANVPSFGEWGWSIASKRGQRPNQRIKDFGESGENFTDLSFEQIIGAFAFSKEYFTGASAVLVNRLNSPTLYNYHAEAWRNDRGIYIQ